MSRRIDITGQKFNRLTAISVRDARTPDGRCIALWTFRCDCGGTCEERQFQVRSGIRKRCPSCEPKTGRKFWDRVDVLSNDECWLWNGRIGPQGYGLWSVKHVNRPAHRIAWQLTNGEIPKGIFVCHKCDVRSCCNPTHLFLGTHDDNMADMTAKGRRPNRHTGSPRAKLFGERFEIFKSRILNGESPWTMAPEFEIHGSTALKIAKQIKAESLQPL